MSYFTVGLTGGIGSGKSTVAALFAKLGVAIIDTDELARQVVAPGQLALEHIAERFGTHVLTTEGLLNRRLLREHIFQNESDRIWLEQLLHPLIRLELQQAIAKAQSPYCMAMIPLLIENLPNPLIQRILVVDVPPELQQQRAILRDRAHPQAIAAIMQTQLARAERLRHADDIIDNTGRKNALKAQVKRLHQLYLSLGSS